MPKKNVKRWRTKKLGKGKYAHVAIVDTNGETAVVEHIRKKGDKSYFKPIKIRHRKR